MNTSHCHEIVLFSFNADTPLQLQLEHMSAIKSWVKTQPGFVTRECFFAAPSNQWVDHVTWADTASAEAAMSASYTAPELASVFKDIDQNNVRPGHYVSMSL